MSAPGRFERARALAKQAVGNAPTNDRVGLITFDDRATVVAPPTRDRAAVLQAIDRAKASFGGTRYPAALSTAVEVADGRRAAIVLVTDLQERGWNPGEQVRIPASVRVETADVGALPEN